MTLPVYTSPDDKFRRLDRVFAVVDGRPGAFRVGGSRLLADLRAEEVHFYPLVGWKGDKYEVVDYTSPNVRVKDIPIGYSDVEGNAIYVTRHPVRSTSAGASNTNLYYNTNNGDFWMFCSNYSESNLNDMFSQKYKPLEDLTKSFERGSIRSGALSIDLAINRLGPKMYGLSYKDTIIGYAKAPNAEFESVLPKGFISLISPKLDKVGVHVKH